MINAWIIDKLRQDKRKQKEDKRPVLQLPVPNLPCQPPEDEVKSPPRGVITFSIGGSDDDES